MVTSDGVTSSPPGEEAAPPLVSQQPTPPPPAPPSGAPPTRPHWGRRALTLVLGCALPLLAGALVLSAPWPGAGDIFDSPAAFTSGVVVILALSLVGGFLLRSWWAVLVVPAAWVVGLMAAMVAATNAYGGSFYHFWDTIGFFALWAALPLAACGALGSWLGMARHRHRQRQVAV